MDTRTGKIHEYSNNDELKKALSENEDLVKINNEDITAKQLENMQVSKHDSVSKLGKHFTGNRKERRRKAKEYKRKLKHVYPELKYNEN